MISTITSHLRDVETWSYFTLLKDEISHHQNEISYDQNIDIKTDILMIFEKKIYSHEVEHHETTTESIIDIPYLTQLVLVSSTFFSHLIIETEKNVRAFTFSDHLEQMTVRKLNGEYEETSYYPDGSISELIQGKNSTMKSTEYAENGQVSYIKYMHDDENGYEKFFNHGKIEYINFFEHGELDQTEHYNSRGELERTDYYDKRHITHTLYH